ncbi:MAG: CHC2 zinc finger domain-containing protein [Vigna little leaf phytoplasma]|nr:CHC2 zinc finger domain-containing protein [Vigna little leaf phytoplasma]
MKKINKSFFKKINDKIPIYELVISCNIVLTKTGKNFMGLCPFHREKTPSFSVSPEKNLAICMACRKGGPPLKFYQQLKNISLEQAIIELTNKFNLPVPINLQNKLFIINPLEAILKETDQYYRNALEYILHEVETEHFVKKYLFDDRKLNFTLIKEFGLGYAHDHKQSLSEYLIKKKFKIQDLLDSGLVLKQEETEQYYDFFRNRLIFPLTNSKGVLVGFAGRLIQNSNKNKLNKYLFNKETFLFRKSNLLYRLSEHTLEIEKKKKKLLYVKVFLML